MNPEDILRLATELMAQYGLTAAGWTVKLDPAKRRLGQCRYRNREIGLSVAVLSNNTAAVVRDTILHEIAHALVGPGHKHGPTWKKMAARIGAIPKSCASHPEYVYNPGHYQYKCRHCDQRFFRHRKIRNRLLACTKCCRKFNGGEFDRRFLIVPVEADHVAAA